MKALLLASLVSFSAMASDCYVRTVDLVTNEVTLAKEICINDIALKLEAFGNSKATIAYTLDGEVKEKVITLNNPIELRSGKVLFFVWSLERNSAGGWCSDSTESSIDARLEMNKDGSDVVLTEIKGSVSTTSDNCHSNAREIQSIDYKLI
jgi:hypothetical protein